MSTTGPAITDVRIRVAPFSTATWLDETRVATPMSGYPPFADRRSTWRGPGSDLVWLYLGTEEPGVFGVGQTRGGAVVREVIRHLVSLLGTANVHGPTAVAEVLYRAAQPYATGGAAAMAVSAVELALWDLEARALGAPLHRLLGSGPRDLPYYLTAPHPDALSGLDADLVAGARLVKVPAAAGPVDGPRAVAHDLERLLAVRERVPVHVPLAVDCFMSWDVSHTLRFADGARREGIDLAWIEEPVRADDRAGHRELRARLGPVRVAAGEHVFGLGDGLRLLDDRCVDVLQSDVTWCGGIGVARTLSAVAAQRGVAFAPHAAALQPWTLHLLAALGPETLTEVLVDVAGAARAPAVPTGPGAGVDPGEAGF